jgi:hypothetical protein
MATVESIGTGGDYTTVQAWYNAHAGDITSDTNAPYIGELMPGTHTGGLDMTSSTTSSTRYFHLRAKVGSRFDGDFAATYPVIKTDGSGPIVNITDNYFRMEHIVVGSSSSVTYGIKATGATNLLLDSVGVYNIVNSLGDLNGIHITDSGSSCIIRNCGIGYLRATASDSSNRTCVGILVTETGGTNLVEITNNSLSNLTASSDSGDATAYGIRVTDIETAYVINNVVGTLTTSTSGSDTEASVSISGVGAATNQNNAGTEAAVGGTNAVNSIIPAVVFEDVTSATLDLHLKDGAPGNVGAAGVNPIRYAGINLGQSGLNLNPATTDADGETRTTELPWSIGLDDDPIVETKATGTGLDCINSDGSFRKVQWRYFYANCPKVNQLCSGISGGYVAASTVCRQQLY